MRIRNRVVTSPVTSDAGNEPMLLTEKVAAERLGVSISFLRKSRCEGTRKNRTPAPPFVCVGGRRYYRATDLRAWVDNLDSRQAI